MVSPGTSSPCHRVAQASFGRHDVIRKAIRSAVGEELADRVYITTPGDFEGYRDGWAMKGYKNPQLEKICHEL
jgi:hypothetical protein